MKQTTGQARDGTGNRLQEAHRQEEKIGTNQLSDKFNSEISCFERYFMELLKHVQILG